MGRTVCWCCGNSFDEAALVRLADHPEVGLCARCAQWLHRRARLAAEASRRGPAVRMRRGLAGLRAAVIQRRVHDWPLVGPLLRCLDRHLP